MLVSTDLPAPGTYRVVEIDPPGLASSTTNETLAAITPGATLDVFFGDYEAEEMLFIPLLQQALSP